VHFGRRKPQFVCEMIARCYNATQDVAHFGFIVDKSQQRFALRALLAGAQNVFGSRIQSNDE